MTYEFLTSIQGNLRTEDDVSDEFDGLASSTASPLEGQRGDVLYEGPNQRGLPDGRAGV